MKSTSNSNLFVFVLIAALIFGPGLLNNGSGFSIQSITDMIPGSHTTFKMLDGEGRRVLSGALDRLAYQIEDDGLRENKIVTKSSALVAIERMLHNRVGTKVNLGQEYPGVGDELMSKIGSVPEFPEGRNYLVSKFRALAEEIK